MAFFGKLFEKKECSVCGGEIGLLGNKKLQDGNLCKDCAAKLSPWFNERRESTVEQIQEQLAYREANQEKVAAFNVTRTMGQNTKVLLDEDAGVFMVTSASNLKDANPDVLAFSDVTGCELDIDEDEREIKHTDREGKQVSYNPPRYKYYYNFYININVRNPYFDDIRFKLNGAAVEIEPPAVVGSSRPMGGPPPMAGRNVPPRPMASGRTTAPNAGPRPIASGRTTAPNAGPRPIASGRTTAPNRPMAAGGRPASTTARPGSFAGGGVPGMGRMMNTFVSTKIDPETDVEFRRYREMGEEIRDALLQVRQQARDEMAAAAAPKAAVTCPWCGATTMPDASGCCEYCGGAVNG